MAKTIAHIAFVTYGYPSAAQPMQGTFVEQLVHAIAANGVRCSVIQPWAIHDWAVEKASPHAVGDLPVSLHRPVYLSAGSKSLGPFSTYPMTHVSFERAALRVVRRLSPRPDAVYGHFLYPGGAAAVNAGRRCGIPSFVAVGEGTFWTVDPVGFEKAIRAFRDVTGVIAVSSLLRKNLIAQLAIPDHKIAVFPNGVNHDRFFPRNREAMRAKFGLPRDLFIVAYVGGYLLIKGVQMAAAAIDGLDGVGGVFAGDGPLRPTGKNVLFDRLLPHEQVPELLSAADVFIMPSVEEGSCNSIIEGMACGLPVIASDGEFNDDLVDNEVSIRVGPHDVPAMRRAIAFLRDNPDVRHAMSEAAIRKAKTLDIRRRARGILEWIRTRIET